MADTTGERVPSELEQRGTTVVLIGTFNPRIFQPMWFAARKLLTEDDVEADSVVVTDGLATFRTREIQLLCARDRCQVGTTETTPTPDIVRDLVVETFTLLRETPIRQVGINHMAHEPSSIRTWDTVAAQLGDPQRRFVLFEGQRLNTVEFRSDRDDGFRGTRAVFLQPSALLTNGVWWQLNDHVDVVEKEEEPLGAGDAIDVLQKVWGSSKSLAEKMVHEIAPRQ